MIRLGLQCKTHCKPFQAFVNFVIENLFVLSIQIPCKGAGRSLPLRVDGAGRARGTD